ncbi:MFS transporter [Paenibacillus sp. FJAT-27812]|uniref:MFS transporter n=1 Tax=Paenibacillus sp. FJAT-27812 TaxID=1684143 RepID=UPI000A5F1997|nr:MFS transporter [Paenibacillus sp. FJAT-27812]
MNLKSRISLLVLAVTATFGTLIAAPAVNLLAVTFPHVNTLLIQWVVTLSSLFILPSLFMASYLARRFPRKHILIVGLLLYLIGGIGPAFASSFTVILVFRAILGIGVGLVSPAFNSLIAENFQGKERVKMNGYVSAINGLGGALFLTVGGIIASYGWRAVFLTYFYTVILLILVVLFLPKFPPLPVREKSQIKSSKIPRTFYFLAVGGALAVMLYFLIPTNLPLYLSDNKIGSASTVGYLIALSMLGTFVAGLSLPALAQTFRKMLVPIALVMYCLGFLTISMAHSVWVVGISVTLIGFAQGLIFPITLNKTGEIVPTASLPAVMSLFLALVYIFLFLSPLFMKVIQALFHFSSTRETFMLLASGLLLTAIGFVFSARMQNRKSFQVRTSD